MEMLAKIDRTKSMPKAGDTRAPGPELSDGWDKASHSAVGKVLSDSQPKTVDTSMCPRPAARVKRSKGWDKASRPGCVSMVSIDCQILKQFDICLLGLYWSNLNQMWTLIFKPHFLPFYD